MKEGKKAEKDDEGRPNHNKDLLWVIRKNTRTWQTTTLRRQAVAKAAASMVLPQPDGPWNSIPEGMPKALRLPPA